MCASRDELGSRYQRRTTKGFDDPNADHPESSSSTDELNRAFRTQSRSPISHSLNRGIPEQVTSQAAGKKAGEPIIDATSMTKGSRRRAQISASEFSIKGQQPTNHNLIDDLGRKVDNFGTEREIFKIQNPRANSRESHLDTNPLMETIPCKDPVRSIDSLEVSGKNKNTKDPTFLAHNSEKEAYGAYEIKEGQRCKGKKGNCDLEEFTEIFPSEPVFLSASCLISEEERASAVDHTISVGSPSRKENQRDREKNTSVIFNGPDVFPMQVDPDEPESPQLRYSECISYTFGHSESPAKSPIRLKISMFAGCIPWLICNLCRLCHIAFFFEGNLLNCPISGSS
ncbi:hypothetical protein U1Q18_023395 [Sarracenia purpurea var. burkii]